VPRPPSFECSRQSRTSLLACFPLFVLFFRPNSAGSSCRRGSHNSTSKILQIPSGLLRSFTLRHGIPNLNMSSIMATIMHWAGRFPEVETFMIAKTDCRNVYDLWWARFCHCFLEPDDLGVSVAVWKDLEVETVVSSQDMSDEEGTMAKHLKEGIWAQRTLLTADESYCLHPLGSGRHLVSFCQCVSRWSRFRSKIWLWSQCRLWGVLHCE
jgi:hypothetical protein